MSAAISTSHGCSLWLYPKHIPSLQSYSTVSTHYLIIAQVDVCDIQSCLRIRILYTSPPTNQPTHGIQSIGLSSSVAKTTNSVLLQVGDDKMGVGYYVEKPMYGKQPQKSSRHDESIAVGVISSSNYDTAVSIIQDTPVDNTSTTWNCQAWTFDALDRLNYAKMFQWDPRAKPVI